VIRVIVFVLLAAFLAAPCRAADLASPLDLSGIRTRAEQGQAAFQAYFGYLYLNGQNGVQQNYEEAFKWYHRAADQGYVLAQYNLGVMYDEGIGVAQSHEAGYFWLTLAAVASGKADYLDRRDKAGQTLTLAQTDELKKRIAVWKPVMAAPIVATEEGTAPAKALTPGVAVPLFRLPPAVQKTINDNVGSGCSIGKIERAVEDGITLYRAQINKPGSVSNIVRVGEGGKLISVGKLQ
jgi:hypothetical protein